MLNRWVFSWCLKLASVSADLTDSRRLFNTVGPAIEKARSPNLDRHIMPHHLLNTSELLASVLLMMWVTDTQTQVGPGHTHRQTDRHVAPQYSHMWGVSKSSVGHLRAVGLRGIFRGPFPSPHGRIAANFYHIFIVTLVNWWYTSHIVLLVALMSDVEEANDW